MEEMYEKLSRHFLAQATAEEEQAVAQFKKENENEYKLLSMLWNRGEHITIKKYDSHKAWKAITAKKSARSISMFRSFSRMAASVALLLGFLTGAYFYFKNIKSIESKLMQANGSTQSKVLLSDSTIVWLNKDAQLSYPDQFSDSNRKVELSGEAFFEVTRNPKKPFIIHTSGADIKVLGTSFNVNTQAENTKVSVTTGTVQVQSNFTSSQVTIQAGYSAKTNEKEIVSYLTDNPNYNSWKTGVFVFTQIPLKAVVEDLNTFYNHTLRLSPDLKTTCGLTAQFDHTPIEEILEVLKLTCDLSIDKTEEGYTLH
jgi:transmembrane sensor